MVRRTQKPPPGDGSDCTASASRCCLTRGASDMPGTAKVCRESCVCIHFILCLHVRTSYVHAVFATSFAVIDDPIAFLQLRRTRRTTSAGGRDAAGTGKIHRTILTLLAREINLLHIAPKIHRTRYRRIYLTRYYTGYYSIFGCCAGYRSCSCSTCRPPTLGCQSCSSSCCRK